MSRPAGSFVASLDPEVPLRDGVNALLTATNPAA
jgi:hypothetical protein